MKKILTIFLVLIYIVGNVYGTTKEELKITSTAAIVMEQSTGRVLYEKNMRKRVKIASTTKILTAIVAFILCATIVIVLLAIYAISKMNM